MNATTAPHAALQTASFVIAFTGEGAAAYVVHGGWDALLARFAQETIGHTPADMAARTHPNHSEWCMWLESLTDPDEWSADDGNLPYCFSSEVGEISHVAIYRLSASGVLVGDGTGQALPPLPESAYPSDAKPLPSCVLPVEGKSHE